MTISNKNILSEILLEITLAIAEQKSYDHLISNTISIWLKRLNCIIGAIYSTNNEHLQVISVIPKYLKHNGEFNTLITEVISDQEIEVYYTKQINELHYYFYKISANHFFVFARSQKLFKEQCYELFPVTKFFGNALESAIEKEEKKKIEKELFRERRLLRIVIDHLPDAVYLKDIDLKKIITNPADIRNIGLPLEEVIDKKDTEVFPPDIAKEFEKDDLTVLNTKSPVTNKEEEIVNINGESRWLSTSKYPLKNEEGQIIGIVGVGRDITEDRSYKEQIERLSLVASQSTNGVIITNVHGEVEWINEGFTRLSGYTLEEMKGRKPGDILQGKGSDPEVIDRMSKAIKAGLSFEEEVINYSKDGTLYHINISCNPLRQEDGTITGFMAIESDITEKIQIESDLIEAKFEAERAKDADQAFLANTSHEMRTPLNAIIGMTSLLKDTPLNEEQKDYITHLDQSSRFLMSLITDILDLSKIESGKIEPKKDVFDLEILLNNVYQSFKIKLNDRPVTLSLNISESTPKYMIGDQLMLHQILNNFLSNAEKFTETGSIKLEVEHITKMFQEFIKFDIIDSGIGISHEDQKKLFQKFNQFGSESKKKQGSGLGLCIARELIEVMSGQVEVTSDIGMGSSFSFKIPYTEVDEDSLNIQDQRNLILNNDIVIDRILVAEDNLVNQKYLSKVLSKLNIEFDLAENGEEAVTLAAQKKYSLIFMDLQMPIMDGYDATINIKSTGQLNQDTPIIALTASALSEQRDRAFEVGMIDFLTKPFTPTQLKEKLNII